MIRISANLACLLALLVAALGSTLGMPAAAQTPPAAESLEYTLAPGDKIRIAVFGEDALTGDYIITSAGNLSFPLVGNLPATSKTVEGLQTALTQALSAGYLNDPRVTIQVIAFRPFFILGEVARPGDYPASTGLTLSQAVSQAGGYTYRANTKKVFIKRATDTAEQLIDVRKNAGIIVRAGDTIRIAERHF